MSAASDLCDAIVIALRGGTYSMAFDPARRATVFSEDDIEDLESLQVYVLTTTRKAERRVQRGPNALKRTYKPVVIVQKKLSAEGDEAAQLAEADQLQTVVEEIEDVLGLTEMDELNFISFNEEQEADAYGIDTLRQAGVFAVAITLEYSE